MSIDSFMTTALVDEFIETFLDGRIQDTVEITPEMFGFEVYANRERHYLLICAEHQRPHAMLTPDRLRRGVQTNSTLGLLLRNRVEGRIITDIYQPDWERIIIFDLSGPDDTYQLMIKLIERHANLILLADNKVVGAVHYRDPRHSKQEIVLPNREYIPMPPISGKIEPGSLNPGRLDQILRRNPDKPAWLALVHTILGFSPLLAKEIVFRAHRDVQIMALDANPYTLDAATTSLISPLLRHQWQPGIAVDENGVRKGVSVFPITHLKTRQSAPSPSHALNQFYGEMAGPAVFEGAKIPIQKQIDKAMDLLQGKLYSLQQQVVDTEKVETLRKSGELLLAYQYSMQPGQTVLEAQYDVDGDPIHIKVDPDLSPLENAQAYFRKYEKAKRAAERVPLEIRKTRQELNYLVQLETDLNIAENWQEIGEVQDELQRQGYWRGKRTSRPTQGKSAPLKFVTSDGFAIWVGKNARQNEQVTFEKGSANDLWLHARGVGGSHVIIKSDNREVPNRVIEQAAALAAYYSKLRAERRVTVMVAERRHVVKPKRGRPGQVLVRQELPSVDVAPRADINRED
jgi:predicted ribosome quality control (RQC) complex YloA/Tae2 family protein